MNTVLIFGTFNPITNAHIQMGLLMQKRLPGCRVIYIPSRNRFLTTWKAMQGRSVMDGQMRVKLMQKALLPYGFMVDDLEITTDISGKTYDTVQVLKEKYPDDNIYICMGTDKVGELHTWYRGEELIAENRFLIICRDDHSVEEEMSDVTRKYSENFTEIPCGEFTHVSASQVRAAYIDGRLDTVRDLIPECVYEYLNTHQEVYS